MELSFECISSKQNINRLIFIHAIYGDEVAAFNVETGNVIEGKLPQKADSMVREWIGIHQEELMHIWNTQEFKAIAPLE